MSLGLLSYSFLCSSKPIVWIRILLTCSDPLRYILTLGYMSQIVRKRYLQIALDNLTTENTVVKKAIQCVKKPDITAEERKNPKLKSSRIISIKGKNNSSLNL